MNANRGYCHQTERQAFESFHSLLRRLNIKKVNLLQASTETSSNPIRHSTNYLLAREVTNEFYLRSILSVKTIAIHVSYLRVYLHAGRLAADRSGMSSHCCFHPARAQARTPG
jgi:hypothetical protein